MRPSLRSSFPSSSSSSSSFASLFPPALVLLAVFSTVARAVTLAVSPSNSSQDLTWTDRVRFRLESSQLSLPVSVSLAPLTPPLVYLSENRLASFNVTGPLVAVDSSNLLTLGDQDIAFVSCDSSAYPGNLNASQTLVDVLTAQNPPDAVLLYSTQSSHCDLTTDNSNNNNNNNNNNNSTGTASYSNILTVLNATQAREIYTQLSAASGNVSAQVVANMSMVTPSSTSPSDSTTGTPNTGASSFTSSHVSPSPTTAVAMIILYSITGIITALFLGIIITGAVRAHRHPERYGPRNALGRPRQSRARGLGRAMLDAIPIVKFGDPNDANSDAVKRDVEMSLSSEDQASSHVAEDHHHHTETQDSEQTESQPEEPTTAPTTTTTTSDMQDHHQQDSTTERQAAGTPTPGSDHPAELANFSCPICTDDFIKGQDLRVLPCNHQFHPDCIDPWLINVSGTCPLCRIDLNPPKPDGEAENHEAEATPETAHAGSASTAPNASQTRQHRRFTTYLHETLNARRMRDASVEERLAALRSVRQVSLANGSDGAAQQSQQRNRLSSFRDRFRRSTLSTTAT
ncbi:hypothetical protein ASPZODRAFT_2129819 [Penicilliopsis zonata CBS 506.65]|uniref:RING-type E3 ubiquitin transferase n=1 Tax=Penicilliopsis zonata CBS 506.65 TaxID=1073090 RepID=A0A1L9SHC8_9EURO|nr:hypothetical protein ASPZODRAFT_2129819 [Penicilliopsis zonata CBS 506.65]OJJ46595.1 hypothetical protein ASPZODRAFT_2129819 [Penicilliopsis zonata CBS 506.65]